ncbi:MAG: HDOD domain-containing protein [Pseudomonadota bacterium]|nr:HDOD domain-containing protein [Pseudomonadota bacterium]
MNKATKQKWQAEMLIGRFHDLLLGQQFAQQQIGYIHTLDVNYGEPLPVRKLLEVEQVAAKAREKQDSRNHQFIADVNADLHQKIEDEIDKCMDNVEYIYKEIIQIQDNIPATLDILAVKSASVGRIDPLITDLHWLGEEILKFINLPQYRPEKDPAKAVRVDNPSLALRYIGLENLKLIVPTFSLKHWTPHSTAPFQMLKRKLWETGMAAGIASRSLAEEKGEDGYKPFVLGMFHGLGNMALIRLYLRLFDALWEKNSREARENGNKDRHTALSEIKPEALFLRNLMVEKGARLSCKLIEHMSLKYLPIAQAMQDIAENKPFDECLPLAQTVLKGRAYSYYKFLQKHTLIEPDEAKALFTHYQFSGKELKLLASTSLQNLQLRIER